MKNTESVRQTQQQQSAREGTKVTGEGVEVTKSFRFSAAQAKQIEDGAARLTDGNESELARLIFELALSPVKKGAGKSGIADEVRRATEYVAAKDAALLFEGDVEGVLKMQYGEKVSKQKRLGNGEKYVADFFVEPKQGRGVVVECKSSSRRDRLELALGQAMIAKHRTGCPVIVVVPYLLPEGEELTKSFETLGCRLVSIQGLVDTINGLVG
jgi:hypothetical protein